MGELVFDPVEYDRWVRAQRRPVANRYLPPMSLPPIVQKRTDLGENWFIVQPTELPSCGTEAGYVRHRKMMEPIDEDCRAAGTNANRERRRRREARNRV